MPRFRLGDPERGEFPDLFYCGSCRVLLVQVNVDDEVHYTCPSCNERGTGRVNRETYTVRESLAPEVLPDGTVRAGAQHELTIERTFFAPKGLTNPHADTPTGVILDRAPDRAPGPRDLPGYDPERNLRGGSTP